MGMDARNLKASRSLMITEEKHGNRFTIGNIGGKATSCKSVPANTDIVQFCEYKCHVKKGNDVGYSSDESEYDSPSDDDDYSSADSASTNGSFSSHSDSSWASTILSRGTDDFSTDNMDILDHARATIDYHNLLYQLQHMF